MAASSWFPHSFPAAILLTVVLVTSFNYNLVRGYPNTDLVYTLCSGILFDSHDPYVDSVGYVLSDVMNITPNTSSYEYYSTSPGSSSVAYGYGACNGYLSESDCHDCLITSFGELVRYCQANTGAQAELVDCKIRFENYPFQE